MASCAPAAYLAPKQPSPEKPGTRKRGSLAILAADMRALRGVFLAVLAAASFGASVWGCKFPAYKEKPDCSGLCGDLVKNGDESDTDCGGPDCTGCTQSRLCKEARDCVTRSCSGGVCQAPTCGDGVANGTETGRDCGGN